MSVDLPAIFFKNRPESLEPPPPETLIDAIRQNTLLRWIAALQAGAIISLAIALVLKSRSGAASPTWAEPKNVSYGDSVLPDTRAVSSLELSAPASIVPSVVASNSTSNEPRSEILRKLESHPSVSSAPQRQTEPPIIKPDLWSLMNDLSKDPRRELLDERFAFGGVTITFKEASPGGLLSFDLSNGTGGPVFLPSLRTLEGQSSAYLERRVLDPGSSMVGILYIEGLQSMRKVTLEFSAANIKSIDINLGAPSWQ